jgi:cell division protein ZapA
MAHVTVTIAGRPYRMACADGEEAHLEALARTLQGKIDELRGSFGEIGDQRITVMAALTLADELAEAKRRIAAFEASDRALAEARDAAKASNDGWMAAVAEKLTEAAVRIESMSQVLNSVGAKPAAMFADAPGDPAEAMKPARQ